MDRRSMLLGSLLAGAAAPGLAKSAGAPTPRGFKQGWRQAAAAFLADHNGDNVVV